MAASVVTWEFESAAEVEKGMEREIEIGTELEELTRSSESSDSSEWEEEEEEEQEDAPSSDWGETEQEVEASYDCQAGSSWVTSIDSVDGVGWDSHAAEEPVVEENDSGYGSSADTPPELLSRSPLALFTTSQHAIKYLQLPFKTKHYFLTYLQRVLEATCLRYAREKLSTYLTDPQWKERNLMSTFGGGKDDRLVFKDWLAEDGMELESWIYMLAICIPVKTRKAKHIMESVMDLRNAATHRGDRGDFGFKELFHAMDFPALIGDEKGEEDITNAFRYIMEDPALDEGAKASVVNTIFTPPPCTSHYRLFDRIQTMLEETCFQYAAQKIPDTLAKNGWEIPEQVEVQRWADIFYSANVQYDSSATDILLVSDSPYILTSLVHGARIRIRNVLAHRLPLSNEDTVKQVHAAIKLCILQGDWQQAIEIEILAEMHLTNQSRGRVLKRLNSAFRNGRVDSLYERERRVKLAGFLAREVGRVVGTEEAVYLSDTLGVEMPLSSEMPWEQRTWSPSMHGCLKIVDEEVARAELE